MCKSLNSDIDKKYAEIIKELLVYIYCKKKAEPKTPLVDIISDYCFKNDYEPELVGDAIKEDHYMSEYVLKDCIYNNIDQFAYTNVVSTLDEW